jgi:hypothetical protein
MKNLLRKIIRKQINYLFEGDNAMDAIKSMDNSIKSTESEIEKVKKDKIKTNIDIQNSQKVASTQTGFTPKLKSLKTDEKKEEIKYFTEKKKELEDKEKELAKSIETKTAELNAKKANVGEDNQSSSLSATPSVPSAPSTPAV